MLSNRDLVLKLTEGNAKRMTRQNNWEEPKQEVGNPFHKTREDFKKNVYDIPLANKAYRIKELQKIYEDWKTTG